MLYIHACGKPNHEVMRICVKSGKDTKGNVTPTDAFSTLSSARWLIKLWLQHKNEGRIAVGNTVAAERQGWQAEGFSETEKTGPGTPNN